MSSKRIQSVCIWMGPVFLVTYLIAFGVIAGYLPPQPPDWSAAQVAMFYAEHADRIRVGQICGLFCSALLFPWFGVLTLEIARIERREGAFPLLALIQFGGATLLVVFFQICGMLWIVATWRPETDPATTRILHETAWLIFVMVAPAYLLQLLCIAVAGFKDRSTHPTWPRWACFFNMWVGVAGTGGAIAVFFKRGPFAWNGLIGFWIPVVMFGGWIVVNAVLLQRSVKRQASERSGIALERSYVG